MKKKSKYSFVRNTRTDLDVNPSIKSSKISTLLKSALNEYTLSLTVKKSRWKQKRAASLEPDWSSRKPKSTLHDYIIFPRRRRPCLASLKRSNQFEDCITVSKKIMFGRTIMIFLPARSAYHSFRAIFSSTPCGTPRAIYACTETSVTYSIHPHTQLAPCIRID